MMPAAVAGWRTVCLRACAAAAVSLWAVHAADAESPGPPDDPVAASAYVVLDRHCARCHQPETAHTQAQADGRGTFANVLDLEAVARDPALVRRGVPDASPIYIRMLSPHPRGSDTPERRLGGRPTADEVLAVRDWLARLPPQEAACGPLVAPSAAAVADAVEAELRSRDAAARRDVRFISLAHLAGACLTDAEVAAYRAAAGRLLNALALSGRTVPVKPVGLSGTLLAVSLTDLGWSEDRWSRVMRTAPRWPYLAKAAAADAPDGPRVVAGDWLAFEARRLPSKFGFEEAADGDRATVYSGLPPIAALARLYARDVDLRRAAAEHGVSEAAFADSLKSVHGPLDVLARWLPGGTLSRPEAELLYDALAGRDAAAGSASVMPRLTLWTDSFTYAPGVELAVSVHTNRPCYLTLINIDTKGRATVLFPNDFERETLLTAGETLRVPGHAAPYRLKTGETGRETFVAICSAPEAVPPGIGYDYERQRFAVLGNWHNFMASAIAESIADPSGKTRARKPPRRRHRAAKSKPKRTPSPELQDIDLRTAITVEVR